MRKNQEFNRSKLSKAIALACFGVASVSMSGAAYAASCTVASGATSTTACTLSAASETATIAGTLSPAAGVAVAVSGTSLTLGKIDISGTATSANDAAIKVTNDGGTLPSIAISGTVTGYKAGINITGTNNAVTITDITNSGTITGTTEHAINLAALGTITKLTNSGTIEAKGTTKHGIALTVATSIIDELVNSGSIIGTGDGIEANNASSALKKLTNSGTIKGTVSGLDINTTTADAVSIENSGTIEGGSEPAVHIAKGAAIASFVNTGVIKSGTTGVNAITVTDVMASGIIIKGKNARIIGNVEAGGATPIVFGDDTTVTSFTTEGDFKTGGAANAVTIKKNATLIVDGHTITTAANAAAVVNNGTLEVPATKTATIATGSYTQGTDGVLIINVKDGTTFGKLVAGAATTLTGKKLQVKGGFVKDGAALAGVLSATAHTTNPTVESLNPLVTYTAATAAHSTTLTASVKTFAQVASTSAGGNDMDSSGILGALDAIYSSEANDAAGTYTVPAKIQTIMDSLLTSGTGTAGATKMGQSIAQLTPAMSGAIANVSITAANGIVGAINNRMDSVASVGSGFSSGDFGETGSWWLKPFGSFGEQDKENGIAGYDLDSRGLAMGYDTDLNNQWRVGVAGAYTRTDVDGNSSTAKQNVDIDTYQANVYGIMKLGADSRLNLQAGIGTSDYDGTRNITFMNEVNKSDYDSTHFTAGATYEKDFPMSQSSLIRANVFADYAYVDVDGYTETTTSATSNTLLKISSQDQDSMIVGVGGAYKVKPSAEGVFSLRAALGYDLLSDKSSVRAQFAGDTNNTSFTTTGIDDEPFLFRGGLGYEHKTSENMSIDARYDAELRSGFDNHAFSVKLKYNY
uniref:Outer membrane autotransporter barrel domain-containing protein n=1 Tax=Candidatus Kentrum sp. FW TaxID=2126338 RepID=A0A450T9S3_9GAMM|nr:MAG: outer membrane autotransporter barrel domain-containing protein [Candidatus Kentron sp. FW]